MLLSAFSWLGRVVWPFIRTLAPWGGPKTTLIVICGLMAVIVIGGPAGAVWMHMRGEIKLCRQSCDLRWQTAIMKEKQRHDELVDKAVRAGRSVPHTPDDRARRLQLCRESPSCRDPDGR